MKDGQAHFDVLKKKLEAFYLQLSKSMKGKKCTMLFPSHWKDLICGEDNIFLIGEVAGFINANSLEGISYALNSAKILKSVLPWDTPGMDHAYCKVIHKLCFKLYDEALKSWALTSAFSCK